MHVLDVYDHYVFRARIEQDLREQLRQRKIHSYEEAAAQAKPQGLLPRNGAWQNKHFMSRPLSSLDYVLNHAWWPLDRLSAW